MADEKNVLIITFPDPSKTFQALSELKGQPGVVSAAVVERSAGGEVRVADSYTPMVGVGTVGVGAVGALIGLIAGPLGLLLGWSSGTIAGATVDTVEAADADDGLTELSKRIPAGGNALLVEMTETSHAIADDIAKDGALTRIPTAEVEAEVKSAQDAARKAAQEARRVRRETRSAEFKAKVGGIFHRAKSS
jgi:uncharacterized membrane protein